MPKMKTNSGSKKRFTLTGTDVYKRQYEIMYGDITGRPEYKAHMMRLQVTENYTVKIGRAHV